MTSRRLACLILMACLLLLLPVAASAASPTIEGKYRISGWDPGQDTSQAPAYTGQAEINVRGETYVFQAILDGQTYTGVGIYDADSGLLSLGFSGEKPDESGVTVLKFQDGVLSGQWTYANDESGRLGRETWTPLQ